jgi:hypothetical protein
MKLFPRPTYHNYSAYSSAGASVLNDFHNLCWFVNLWKNLLSGLLSATYKFAEAASVVDPQAVQFSRCGLIFATV